MLILRYRSNTRRSTEVLDSGDHRATVKQHYGVHEHGRTLVVVFIFDGRRARTYAVRGRHTVVPVGRRTTADRGFDCTAGGYCVAGSRFTGRFERPSTVATTAATEHIVASTQQQREP